MSMNPAENRIPFESDDESAGGAEKGAGAATASHEANGDADVLLPAQPEQNGAREMLSKVDWSTKTANESVALLIDYAVQLKASDVFFSCEENHIEVTVRQLGMVRNLAKLSLELGIRCIAHIRAMSGLKIDERRRPQDGRWIFRRTSGETVDLRLNTLPTLWGETVATRILPRNSDLWKLEKLGFVGPQLGQVENILSRPSGLVLVTGPTGSGKTTTMYALLHHLNTGRLKIHTIEDPVEYSLEGCHQSQVNEDFGAGFAELLRAVVRQGPDVIMIGEVRDTATAETAVRAANSGQFVCASVHAPVAVKAVQSMLALGCSPYMLCSSLMAVIGQRLIRTLDPENRVAIDLSSAPHTFDEVRPWLKQGQGETVYATMAHGDANAGYTGRSGVFELLVMTPAVQRMIREMQTASNIFEQALADGMIDFRRAALLKVASGETSFDEMYRALPMSDEIESEPIAHPRPH
ncbi:MAG: GspE/PulE family protein [Pirellulaceae bacterium]